MEDLDRMLADQVGFLRRMPRDVVAALIDGSILTRYPRGRVIFEGTEQSWSAISVSGMQRVYLMAVDGRQVTIRYVQRGALLGALRWPTRIEARIATQATNDSALLQLRPDRLVHLLPQYPILGVALADEYAERLAYAYRALHRQAFTSTRVQVAADLMLRMEGLGHSEDQSSIEATNQEIADSVGTVREVVARIISEFRRQGIISRSRGRITVLVPERLREEMID